MSAVAAGALEFFEGVHHMYRKEKPHLSLTEFLKVVQQGFRVNGHR